MNTIAYLFVVKLISAVAWYTVLAILGVFTLSVLVLTLYKMGKERIEREKNKREIKEKVEKEN